MRKWIYVLNRNFSNVLCVRKSKSFQGGSTLPVAKMSRSHSSEFQEQNFTQISQRSRTCWEGEKKVCWNCLVLSGSGGKSTEANEHDVEQVKKEKRTEVTKECKDQID